MEKAIEIKRRAQRCVQNGDLDGALREYEKLVETPESDPYNFVLLADLLFKKGEPALAAERYLNAVTAYEKASLFKNAIAVCKKMMRLSLSQATVLRHLAELHALDGLTSEASMYYSQYAEHQVRANQHTDAAQALRKAFDNGQENVKLLEQLSEVLLLEGENAQAAAALLEAAGHWSTRGQEAEARRCRQRAHQLDPVSVAAEPQAPALAGVPVAPSLPVSESPAAPGGGLDVVPTLAAVPPEALPAEPITTSVPVSALPPETPISGVSEPAMLEVERTTLAPAGPLSPVEGPPALELSRVMPSPLAATEAPQDSSIFERAPRFVAPPALEIPNVATPPVPSEPAPLVSEDEPEDEAVTLDDGEEAADQEGVYEIAAEEPTDYERALREAEAAVQAPAPLTEAQISDPTPSVIARRPDAILDGVVQVEHLLQRAQDEFRAGNRDAASQALVEAALTYETLGRYDSAATIFRSLGRGAQAPQSILEQWLSNCERRDDRNEGSQVACELGDRALNEGQDEQARRWFEHASVLDPSNETARRRLQRMRGEAAPAAPAAPAAENGRVEVALGRGQAVTFDLAGLLQEFQRGVESQLEGDAQGHYDLGMAYREMGLHEQAVESFRVAQNDVRLAGRAREMIGRCFADRSEHAEAVPEYEQALKLSRLDAAGEAELRYQLALSMAAVGDLAGAVAQLEIADMRFPGRTDITERLADWRRAFGQAA